MSNVCESVMPAGLNADCLVPLSQIRNAIILEKGTAFDSKGGFLNSATWETKIKQGLSVWVSAGLMDYEVTTDDANIKTSGLGKKIVTNAPIPSTVLYLDGNYCDYSQLRATLKGGTYDVIYVLEDGTLHARLKSDGKYYGFGARVNAVGKGISGKGDLDMNFVVQINHLSYDEFSEGILLKPAWNPELVLAAAMPIGLNLSIVTPYSNATGVVVVRIHKRCGAAYLTMAVADIEIVETNDLDTPVVTSVTDNSDGTYDLLLQIKVVPESMAVGDYMILRVKELSGSDVVSVSNRQYIQAYA